MNICELTAWQLQISQSRDSNCLRLWPSHSVIMIPKWLFSSEDGKCFPQLETNCWNLGSSNYHFSSGPYHLKELCLGFTEWATVLTNQCFLTKQAWFCLAIKLLCLLLFWRLTKPSWDLYCSMLHHFSTQASEVLRAFKNSFISQLRLIKSNSHLSRPCLMPSRIIL